MKLLIANSKGGVSKTTIATNLAVWIATQLGEKVAIVDLDHNRNSYKWWLYRTQATLLESTAEIKAFDLHKNTSIKDDLAKLEEEYGNVIIDSAGYDSNIFRESLIFCDSILLPTRPNQADIESTGEIMEVIEEANEIRASLDFDPVFPYVYLTQVPTNSRITVDEDARKTLEEVRHFATVIDSANYNRIAYSHTYKMGLGVMEMSLAANKAKEEVTLLANQLFNLEQ